MSKHVLLGAVLAVAAITASSSSHAASKGSFWQSFYSWLGVGTDEGCVPSELNALFFGKTEVDDCGVQEPQ